MDAKTALETLDPNGNLTGLDVDALEKILDLRLRAVPEGEDVFYQAFDTLLTYNGPFDALRKPVKKEGKEGKDGGASREKAKAEAEAKANEISSACPELTVEICGVWVWISGETKPHAGKLKGMGCKFAAKKEKWYWRPAGYGKPRKGKKPIPMQAIRARYGSKKVKEDE